MKLLIAEDEKDLNRILSSKLRKEQYTVDACYDGVPVLGTVEEAPGLILECGFTGHGFGIAPGCTEQIAKLIVTGKTDVDLSELHYDRFKAKI